jgi:hypothetical protein
LLLFLHILGALGLFASIGLEQVGLYRLRRARTGMQVNEWLSILMSLRRIDAPAGLLLLATGIYFVVTRWGHQPWAGLAIIGMIVMALLGILVSGRRLKTIRWETSGTNGPVSADVMQRLHDPVLSISANVRAAIGVGIVFDMVMKPAAGPALTALIVTTILGALVTQGRRVSVKSGQVTPAS